MGYYIADAQCDFQQMNHGMLNDGHGVSVHSINQHKLLQVNNSDFIFFKDLILSRAGIDLAPDKIKLLEGRLGKRLRALKLKTFSDYRRYLENDMGGKELKLFINSLTTNKTEFFRELFHFAYLSKILLQKMEYETIYFWSAACSSGEEPYSMAIMCEELFREFPTFSYKILATDIDTERLNFAANGVYPQDGMDNLSAHFRDRYFSIIESDEHYYKVTQTIRKQVKFRPHNLIDYSDKVGMIFNVIFLRNVLIYFSKSTSEKIVAKLVDRLEPGGFLFVGLTESLVHMDVGLTKVAASIYQKKEN